MTNKEEYVILYYESLFGDDISLQKIIFDKHIIYLCEKTGYKKEEILEIVKKYIDEKNS